MSYWDTACLVKLYVPEPNSAVFEEYAASLLERPATGHRRGCDPEPDHAAAKIASRRFCFAASRASFWTISCGLPSACAMRSTAMVAHPLSPMRLASGNTRTISPR